MPDTVTAATVMLPLPAKRRKDKRYQYTSEPLVWTAFCLRLSCVFGGRGLNESAGEQTRTLKSNYKLDRATLSCSPLLLLRYFTFKRPNPHLAEEDGRRGCLTIFIRSSVHPASLRCPFNSKTGHYWCVRSEIQATISDDAEAFLVPSSMRLQILSTLSIQLRSELYAFLAFGKHIRGCWVVMPLSPMLRSTKINSWCAEPFALQLSSLIRH